MQELHEHHSDFPEAGIFNNFNRLLGIIHETDERGAVLSLAAFAEEGLGRALLAYLIDVDAAKALVEGFNAPLGTFAARIKACHAIGIISAGQYRDFEQLRKIRNAFAHTWEGCSLIDKNLSDRVSAMKPSRLANAKNLKTPRDQLTYSVVCLLIELEVFISSIVDDGRRLKSVAMHMAFTSHGGSD